MTIQVKIKSNRALIIFVRSPKLGKVKTRLAKEVGDQRALDIYKQLLAHTREQSIKVDAIRLLFYSDEIVHDEWSEDQFKKSLQVNGDLGDKMLAAFKEALMSCNQAIIIGSDCPQLNSSIIDEAFDKLENQDIVIGPTYDGGYYLIGMKKIHKDLFLDMTWSTSEVCAETISRISARDLSYSLMPVLSDVDYKEDWDKHGFDNSASLKV